MVSDFFSLYLLFFLLDLFTLLSPCPFLLSLSLSLLSSISEFCTLSGSLLLSLVLLSWSTTPPVTAAMEVMLDLENSLSFSLNFLFLLSGPTLFFVAVRYLSQPLPGVHIGHSLLGSHSGGQVQVNISCRSESS